ncbi:hypothetical protein [Thalassotalea litorea]|uniref:hypothetical protein n=1 Tax=Thalassotalea litorea TaxID=2020715 RepID=UPI003735888B
MMNAHMLKFKILYKAQAGLLELSVSQLISRLIFILLALCLFLITFVFINIGCYQLLATQIGQWQSAFVLGTVNLALTLLMLWFGRSKPPSKEQVILEQAREMAIAEIQADGQQVKNLMSPGNLSSGTGLITLVSMMLDIIRRRKKHQ